MEFRTEAQRRCYEKVRAWLTEMHGEQAMPHTTAPEFGMLMGSALVRVVVRPWDDDDAVITVVSYVVLGPDLTPDLMRFLLDKNAKIPFGAFGVDDDGDITFYHSLIGNTCDKPELKTAIRAVGLVADRFDDEIVSRWGGQRAVDRVP